MTKTRISLLRICVKIRRLTLFRKFGITTNISEHRFADPDLVTHALVEGKKLRVDLSLDDIEEIQGYVAAEANHTKNAKLRNRLDKLFDKFQKLLDEYDDQHEGK